MAILGISTNTRLLGLAIIKDGGLEDYSIHLHKSSWSPSKVDLILASLEPCVRQYSVTEAVLSIPPAHHQAAAFSELLSALQNFFGFRNIPLHTVSRPELYALCPKGHTHTKGTLMQALVLMYPQLYYCYHKERRNKKRYYFKLFEAVAAGTLRAQTP